MRIPFEDLSFRSNLCLAWAGALPVALESYYNVIGKCKPAGALSLNKLIYASEMQKKPAGDTAVKRRCLFCLPALLQEPSSRGNKNWHQIR